MKLDEVLSTPYKFTILNTDGRDLQATFKLDSDEFITVDFEWWGGPEMFIVSFRRNGETKLTGEGDALRIFATVIKIIKTVVDDEEPPFIGFSSTKEEQSRVSLYYRLARKFAAESDYRLVKNLEDISHRVAPLWIKNMAASIKNSDFIVLAREELVKT